MVAVQHVELEPDEQPNGNASAKATKMTIVKNPRILATLSPFRGEGLSPGAAHGKNGQLVSARHACVVGWLR
jgi:hypothetical protein